MRIRIHSPGLHQANSPILVVELSGCWLSRATCGRTWWSPGTRWPPPTSGWVTGPRTSCRYSYRVTLVLGGSGFDFHFDVIRIWDMPVPTVYRLCPCTKFNKCNLDSEIQYHYYKPVPVPVTLFLCITAMIGTFLVFLSLFYSLRIAIAHQDKKEKNSDHL